MQNIVKVGDRIILDADMNGERYYAGDTGTVVHIDDLGTLHMCWDKGGSLGVIPGEDSYHVIK